ncbi:MAG: SprB repeat-containing protein [Crocinitomicaceae bacterium]|nr:SprB repeat-containing protein [Crocinitomicaceae bacterium]
MSSKAFSLIFLFIASSTISLAGDNIVIEIVEIVLPTCNGQSNGSATIEAKGGEAPYTYSWNTFPNQYERTAYNLAAGTYFIEVTDANGDVSFRTVYVDDPNKSVLVEKENVDINEVDLTTTVQGKNSPYSYTLNDSPVTSVTLNDLSVGIHRLVVTDAEGCEMVQYIQLSELETADGSGEIVSSVHYSAGESRTVYITNLSPNDPNKSTSREHPSTQIKIQEHK